jgi:ABC-type uncharacterized transport system permease subunit
VIPALFVAVGVLYAAACVLYLAHLTRDNPRFGVYGNYILGAAVVAHMGYLAARVSGGATVDIARIYESLSLLSLVMVVAFLITAHRYKMTVLGAFLTPVALLTFLGASLAAGAGRVSREVQQALLPLHIGANVLGIAAFTLAAAAAVGYLIQERLLRSKQVGGVFRRLPPLDRLDTLGFRALLVGFPLLSVGFVTGAIWVARGANTGGAGLSPAQAFGTLAWFVFAAVLILRSVAGWRGKKAALGTLVGFLCTAAALVGYVVSAMGLGQ